MLNGYKTTAQEAELKLSTANMCVKTYLAMSIVQTCLSVFKAKYKDSSESHRLVF